MHPPPPCSEQETGDAVISIMVLNYKTNSVEIMLSTVIFPVLQSALQVEPI